MKNLWNIFFSFFAFFSFNINASDIANQERTFYFVRHGITNWGMENILEGPQDLPLNDKGKSHIETMVRVFQENLANPEEPIIILHSHLKRCVETASILARGLSAFQTTQIEGLHEVYRGDWGKLDSEVKTRVNFLLKNKEYQELSNISVPDAERWNDFLERIQQAIASCLQSEPSYSIIVTHGQVIKEFLKIKKCWSEELISKWSGDNRPPIRVTYKGGTWAASIME